MVVAQNWAKPPPDAMFNLRVPVEYASIHAAVCQPVDMSVNILLNPSL